MNNLLIKYLNIEEHGKDLYLLLIIGWLYSIGLFLSNTFVNIYLWRQTEDYFTIAFYHLSIYIAKSITFIIAGKIVKKIDRVIVLRLGVTFLSLFFLTVLYLQENAAKFNVLLGVLIGIGYGFYWLSFNVLTFEITEPFNRVFFNGLLGGLQSISGMIGPLLAGTIILRMDTSIGYMTIFTISFLLFIFAIIISFFLQRRETDGIYNLSAVTKQIFLNKSLRLILLANFSQGIRDGIFLFVISIWIFLTTRNEFSLGMFNLLLNSSSLFVFVFLLKLMKDENRRTYIFIGSIIISFAIWIILNDLSFSRLLLYAFVVGIGFPIIIVPFQSLTYDIIGKGYDAKNLRIEYIVLLEIFSNLGSIIAIAIFIIILYTVKIFDPIPLMLAIFSLSYLMIYLFVSPIKFSNIDVNKQRQQNHQIGGDNDGTDKRK